MLILGIRREATDLLRVVIPAAGLGKRFLPLSRFVPKELLPLGGRPLIHHALDEAARGGFDSAVVVIAPGKPALRAYLEGVQLPLPVDLVEQPAPAGLGDAVFRCGAHVAAPFAVLLPDDVLPGASHWAQLLAAHNASAAAALCVRRVPVAMAGRFGMANCTEDGGWLRVISMVEKPGLHVAASSLAILGRYLVTAQVLAALEDMPPSAGGEVQLTDGFGAVAGRPPGVVAVRYEGDVLDCGTPQDYERAVARHAGWIEPGAVAAPFENSSVAATIEWTAPPVGGPSAP